MKNSLVLFFCLISINLSAQINLDVEGKVKISIMDLINSADSVVVRLADGTLAVRDASTLGGVSVGSLLEDADGDTQIMTEANADEDLVRINLAGTLKFLFDTGRLEFLNSGNSVFIGEGAGANDDLSDNDNVAIGAFALQNNTTGFSNTATGALALQENIAGHSNTALGAAALNVNNFGSHNTANGALALFNNLGGSHNTALGSAALRSNTTGNSNIAIGNDALNKNTTRSGLVAIGDSSLFNNGIGAIQPFQSIENTAIGTKVLYTNTTGRKNTGVGSQALYLNIYGNSNTATGSEALYSNTDGDWNTAIGERALYSNNNGLLNNATGTRALYWNVSGNANVANGAFGLFYNTTGDDNIAIGANALYYNTDRSGLVAVGDSCLFNNGTGANVYYDATENTAIGSKALFTNTTGRFNTASGSETLYSNSSGSLNSAAGYLALYSNTTGTGNTANGHNALYSNTIGNYNTSHGLNALSFNMQGHYRTAIGYSANSISAVFSNNTGLGYDADCTASNQVRVGNASVTSIGGHANWSNVSDARFKTNVNEKSVAGMDFIRLLKPVTYNINLQAIDDWMAENYQKRDSSSYNEKNEKSTVLYSGFIAQEVEAAAQSIGYDFSGVDAPKSDKDYYGLRYAEFVVPLVKAVQEMEEQYTKQISKLQSENQRLKVKCDTMEGKLAYLIEEFEVLNNRKLAKN